uniref:Uncharacterized protein n=1 Tax=Pithovirus LCPAC401 TaxID=2506595 RepID=A0A481ZB27_9VIRU|nr:MAG: uncharacterized protein LCPAC401_02930 [Pithovirus LCPAC401]
MNRRSNRKRGNGRKQENNELEKHKIVCDILFVYYMLMTFSLMLIPNLSNNFSSLNMLKIGFNITFWLMIIPSVPKNSMFFIIYVLCGMNIILIGEYNNIIVTMIIINFFVSIAKDVCLYMNIT